MSRMMLLAVFGKLIVCGQIIFAQNQGPNFVPGLSRQIHASSFLGQKYPKFPLTNQPGKQKAANPHLKEIMGEVRQADRAGRIQYDLPEHRHTQRAKPYEIGLSQLASMAGDTHAPDLKRAVFVTENAFYGNSKSYADFEKKIDGLVLRCRNDGGNHASVQSLFPAEFAYDHHDPFGVEDYSRQFVTKLIETGTGQCRSLPILYKLLANELGLSASIAFTPMHSFITYTENGHRNNFETTNGYLVANSWMVGSGFITAEAISSGIWMRPMDDRQTLAYLITDLARIYCSEIGWDSFVMDCVNQALKIDSECLFAKLIRSDYYTYQMQYITAQIGGNMSWSQFRHKYPEGWRIFEKMKACYAEIDRLGYEQLSEVTYRKWVATVKDERRKR